MDDNNVPLVSGCNRMSFNSLLSSPSHSPYHSALSINRSQDRITAVDRARYGINITLFFIGLLVPLRTTNEPISFLFLL